MRHLLRPVAILAVLLAGWAAPPPLAQAANLDNAADHVFGQPNFAQSIVNNGGISDHSLSSPPAGAIDPQGNLYVAELSNNRVLEYDAPLTSDRKADRVFGQPDFSHNGQNYLGINAIGLAGPVGLALDAHGNLYLADYLDSRVLEYDDPLTSDRIADRVFGQPNFSTADANHGSLGAGSLYRPAGVALDAQGRLYVADTYNNRVLEYDAPLTSDQSADVVFGQGGAFTTNDTNHAGIGKDSLNTPELVSLDAGGDLYVSDTSNNRVLEYNTPLTSDTTADRVFGQPDFTHGAPNNGGISASRLNTPEGVILDAVGNLFVADFGNNRLLEFDLPIARAAPTLAALSPSRLAAGSPAFTLTVNGAGYYGNSVVRWNGSNRPTTYINSTRLTAAFSSADLTGGGPFAVTVFTPSPGGGATSLINLALYARGGHDTTADVVQGQPNFAASVANNPNMLSANAFHAPIYAAIDPDSGRLFVADYLNNRVLSWLNAPAFANGQPADLVLGQPDLYSTWPNAGGRGARTLRSPYGLALDSHGNLYVADHDNERVLEYNAPLSTGMAANHVFGQGGNFSTAIANNGGVSANSLSQPWGVALDGQDNLYVADAANNRVLEYDNPLTTDRTADHVFGQLNSGSNDANHGSLSATSLYDPQGLALDGFGNLYVADRFNNRVLVYDAPLTTDRTADHVIGQPNLTSGAANNGGPSASSLYDPAGLALDGFGNLYVADRFNNRVLEYDAPLTNRTADRVFGQPGFSSNAANNGGTSADSLNGPTGVALDGQNNLYIADIVNNRVLEFDWALVKVRLPLMMR